MRRRVIIAILLMGLSGIVAEILLLRELLITFYGNELSIGIILANWLILEAIGAFFLGKRAEHSRKKLEALVAITIAFALFFPAAIYATRIIKVIIGVTAGEALGLIPILISSFFILLPVSVSHGALFTFCCKIYSLHSKEGHAASIGRVYVYETLGTIIGGIALTYLLIPHFHSLKIAFAVSLLNMLLCVYLLMSYKKGDRPPGVKILARASIALSLLFGLLLFTGGADKIHRHSVKGQWRGEEIVHYKNSIYGNIAVAKRDEQYTFFSDGVPIITTPVPDVTFAEEFVHLPMLSHPQPEEILVITGGAGGVINEILKHPSVERVDYAELDPLILEAVEKFPTPLTETELSDPRVHVQHLDGRFFFKTTPRKYDLVLIGLPNPSDLQVNRLFTKEFFALVKKHLREDGILVINLPGSLTYLGDELRDLNLCIINTLKEIYPYVRIIPGDFNIFLASASPGVASVDHRELSRQLKRRDLEVSLLTPAHIKYRLSPEKLDWFSRAMEGGTGRVNQDFLPIGVFYSLSYRNARFSTYMRGLFRVFEKIDLRYFFIPIIIITSAFLLIRTKIKKWSLASIPICIITTGFAGMIFDLVLIFAFQALYGYVFHWIGLLVTALMAGAAAGSLMMTSLLERMKREFTSFIKIEALIVLFSAALPVTFLILHPYLDRPGTFFLEAIFLLLSFISGFLIGAQFPLANKMYLDFKSGPEEPDMSSAAGLLYGADLLGGWIGGIIGGVILLPVLGLLNTCMVVVALKVCSLIIFAVSMRRST